MRYGTIAVILFVGTVGCQRDRDRTMESLIERVIASKSGRESKVTIDREHASIAVDLGAATRPKGWPAAVPFYPRASRAKLDVAADDVQHLVVTTDDSAAAIRGFYSQELARLGWQVGEEEDGTWVGRRGAEHLQLRILGRDSATRAEIEYRRSGTT